jgi:6-phosphogluconolactonase
MLGLGDDGHTASIFPGNTRLFKSEELFEMAENPYSRQKRITATGKMINNAKTVVFAVTGESKAEMVSWILERKEGWEQLPASAVQPFTGELRWLLDEKAAALLSSKIK